MSSTTEAQTYTPVYSDEKMQQLVRELEEDRQADRARRKEWQRLEDLERAAQHAERMRLTTGSAGWLGIAAVSAAAFLGAFAGSVIVALALR